MSYSQNGITVICAADPETNYAMYSGEIEKQIHKDNYEPETTMENLISNVILHFDSDDNYGEYNPETGYGGYGDSFALDECLRYVEESGGWKEFDYYAQEVLVMTITDLKNKISEIIKNISLINEDGGIEIYTDYQERELSNHLLKEIFESEKPREYFNEKLCDWAFDYQLEYGADELEKAIKDKLSVEEIELYEEHDSEMWNFISEQIYFYYNADDFNNDINVNIMVDCGNWNYDCVCDNVLNWYGNSGDGSIDKESSMLWLAKTQGKATALRKACKKKHRDNGYYADRDAYKDKFIESCIQEFENLPSHMATVTFLVKMPLFKLFDLIELQNKEYDEKGKYDPRKNENSKSYMVLGKETMCGLYDPWSGGGSVLEVELDKDVKLPIKYAIFCVEGCKMRGYDVDEVYGLVDSCWKETVKEIKRVA